MEGTNRWASPLRVAPHPIPLPMNKAPLPVTSPQGAPAAVGTPAPAQPRKRKGKTMLVAALLAGLAAGGYYGWHWWTVGRFQESTDNAFLQADKVTIAPKVAAFISAVLVGDNQAVKAGDVVATIDDADSLLSGNFVDGGGQVTGRE
jgi:membrane fusion protein, multidrug efflux system